MESIPFQNFFDYLFGMENEIYLSLMRTLKRRLEEGDRDGAEKIYNQFLDSGFIEDSEIESLEDLFLEYE